MKKLVTGLAAAVLVAATVSLVLWFQLRGERERGMELAASLGDAPMTEMAEVLVQPMVAPPPPPGAGQAGTTPVPSRAAVPANAPADPMAGLMQAMMQQTYPDLAEELDLTASEAAQFLELFARLQNETGMQFMDLMTGGTMDAARRQQRQLEMLEKERADEAALRRQLGNKYPRWEQYQSKAEARMTVNELRKSLATVGNPLSDQQAEALVTIFANDALRDDEEERAWLQSAAARNSPNLLVERMQRQFDRQKRWVDLAAPRLDSVQLEHFRSTIAQQEAMLGAMMGMMGGAK